MSKVIYDSLLQAYNKYIDHVCNSVSDDEIYDYMVQCATKGVKLVCLDRIKVELFQLDPKAETWDILNRLENLGFKLCEFNRGMITLKSQDYR